MAKAAPDTETVFEIWVNRSLGKGVGRYVKAATEADAMKIAETLKNEPNLEVLKVTTTRKPIKEVK